MKVWNILLIIKGITETLKPKVSNNWNILLIIKRITETEGGVAQLVERHTVYVNAVGSNPISFVWK